MIKCFILFVTSSLIALLNELANKATSLDPIMEAVELYASKNMLSDIPVCKPISSFDKHRISSSYGWRTDPFSGQKKYHSGIDYACELATAVHASANGVVTYAAQRAGYGRCIIIQHSYGFTTIYGHLSACYVCKGDVVTVGKIVGFVGSTGRSTGNHLHFEVRKNNKIIKPLFVGKSNENNTNYSSKFN